MSTQPGPSGDLEQRGADLDAPGFAPGFDTPPGPRPRVAQRSGKRARVITALYALIVTPLAMVLLADGGVAVRRVTAEMMSTSSLLAEILASPEAPRILLGLGGGTLLLASVVASGIVSSAGPVVGGLLGIPAVAVSAVPALLLAIYRLPGPAMPSAVIEGLVIGHPLILHPLLGGAGLALILARRDPRAPLIAALLLLVLVPLTLLLGAGMLFTGHASGAVRAATTLEGRLDPASALTVLAGVLLVVVAVGATRKSPYALLVPALVLLVASTALGTVSASVSAAAVLPDQTVVAIRQFLTAGGGVAAAAVMLVHTGALALVRARSRRVLARSAGTQRGA